MARQVTIDTMFNAANGGGDIANAPYIETTWLERWTASMQISVSAATLVAALRILGTNDDAQLAPPGQPLNTLVALSPLSAGITVVNGVITFASPAIATYNIIFSLGAPMPKWIKPDYDWTSGGGTVVLTFKLNAYGLNS